MAFWYPIKLLIFVILACSALTTWWIANTLDSRITLRKFLLRKLISNAGNDKILCSALVQGDQSEIDRARIHMNENPRKNWTTPQKIITLTKECDSYRKRYVLEYLTEEEKNFPIAYSIMMYKDIEQVERLLRAIYRPQNYYCIHVDKKAKAVLHEAMKSIASCFQNVFSLSDPVDVRWGGYSVLEPSIKCLHKLSKYKNWKYYMNLSGQEFPIRTNYEIVRILKVYNGTNDVESDMELMRRFSKRVVWVWQDKVRTTEANTPFPGVKLYKGEYHVVLARSFVDYVLNNAVAREFLEWMKTTGHPDENYFNSLNHNPQLHIPGAPDVKGKSYPDYSGAYIRHKLWRQFKTKCHGKYTRNICIMGVGDLQGIAKSPALFVNKFHLDFEPLALDCMEEWFAGQTKKFYEEPWRFRDSIYRYPPFDRRKYQ